MKTLKNISATSIRMMGKNNTFDSNLIINNKNQSVECTLAINGQQRRLTLEHLKTYTWAPGNTEIQKNEATKASGKRKIIETEPVVLSSEESGEKLKKELYQALQKKIIKKNPEYSGAWLVISFFKEDYNILEEQEIKDICSLLIQNQKSQFERIYFIGLATENSHFIYSAYFEDMED